MQRLVQPEILDDLDPADKRAVRSRSDLRLVNWFMRGEHWVISELRKLRPKRVVELGAGDGHLVNQIKSKFPDVEVIGVDLIEKPSGVLDSVEWISGNVMDDLAVYDADTVVVANLFLHHLEDDQLCQLGESLVDVSAFLFSEPFRAKLPQMMGRAIFPFVNEVTKHDMIVSIKAGFTKSELPELLGDQWNWTETKGMCGGLRTKGIRK